MSLMNAQRAAGVDAELVTFTPGLLNERMAAAGFRVHSLGTRSRRVSMDALASLRHIVRNGPPPVLHTHEYKANIIGRVVRGSGTPMRKLVATCHGWVDRSPQLDFYFALDRWTAFASDLVTVTDPWMISRFPPAPRPRRLEYVQNAIENLAPPTPENRAAARAHFGFSEKTVVVGTLGRLTPNKGVGDVLAAASRTAGSDIVWAIAGSGPLEADVVHSKLPNVRFLGYQVDTARYLSALDIYLQASHFEGLSLSLLESMRAALPSIATKAGATEVAVRDRREGLLVDAGAVDSIVRSAMELAMNENLRNSIGSAARLRFEEQFSIERQHAVFMELYLA